MAQAVHELTAQPMHGVVRRYAWGSRSVLARLQGRPTPSETPEAELWLGAHPGAPATVGCADHSVSLADLVAHDPERQLGAAVTDTFGARLPYLLKVLAAETPLSLQAHPDADQARAGHAAGHPCYVDQFHKPELLVAITQFDALCGFRPPRESATALAALGLPVLDPVVATLRTGVAGLAAAVRALLAWPDDERVQLVTDAVAVASKAPDDHPHADAFRLVCELGRHYPDDPGVLVALLLNHVCLSPGEAIWMPAGNLHAYLRGAGVEIMAASDNVLRGGLTPKHVDVDELLRVLRFEVLEDPLVTPIDVAPGVVTWPVPVREFALHRVRVGDATPRVTLDLAGPRIVFCLTGQTLVDDGRGKTPLAGGAALFVPAGGPLSVTGVGEAFVASVGQ